MKKKLKALILALVLAAGVVVPSGTVYAEECTETEFLGLRSWHYGLEKDDKCNLKSPTTCEAGSVCDESEISDGLTKFVWMIVLNVLVDLFVIAGVVAVGFLIYGGYLYLRSGGDPGFATRGRKTITAALVGLAIVTLANVISRVITTILSGARADGTTAIVSILNSVYPIMGLVAVAGIIFGAVVWTTSQGDPGKVKKGRDAIIYAVIGLAIVLLAVAITNLVIGAAS